ncbi:hypothetical protein FRC03_005376 [Tulasnella sp. 419]|nr:hypothetical protein FRC03_005376 [Tulasnella sp. 419]
MSQEPSRTTSNDHEDTDLRTRIVHLQADLHGLFNAERRLQNFDQWTRELLSLTDWKGLIPREEGARDIVPNDLGVSRVKEEQQQQTTEEPIVHEHVAKDESHPEKNGRKMGVS